MLVGVPLGQVGVEHDLAARHRFTGRSAQNDIRCPRRWARRRWTGHCIVVELVSSPVHKPIDESFAPIRPSPWLPALVGLFARPPFSSCGRPRCRSRRAVLRGVLVAGHPGRPASCHGGAHRLEDQGAVPSWRAGPLGTPPTRPLSRRSPVNAVAVIDFETTGMCAGPDRIIEVGAAILHDGEVVATFSELMDPGFRIPYFITGLTGITDAMVRGKPRPEAVMPRLREFLGDHSCVAHNAGFDQRFFASEMDRAGHGHERPFLCSVLLARRLVEDAPNHKLGDLARHLGLQMPPGMRAHRALADVLMTCQLWNHLRCVLRARLGGREPDLGLMQVVMRMPKAKVGSYLEAARA